MLIFKITLILLAAFFGSALLRRSSAAVRHTLWTLAMSGVLLVPMLSATLARLPAPAILYRAGAAIEAGAGRAGIINPWPSWIVTIWMCGTLGLLSRWFISLWQTWRLTRCASPLQGWHGMPRVAVRTHQRIYMPMTWGWLRPVILLPEEAKQWPAERRRVVLLHELAHVQREDWLAHILSQLACAIYWFHPLVWFAAWRMQREREAACDDVVLGAGVAASDYASDLVELAQTLRSALAFAGPAIVCRSQLETRVRAILDPRSNRGGVRRRVAVALTATVALALLPIAALQGSRIFRAGGDVTRPQLISKREPAYTEAARKAKIHGTVLLVAEIEPDGRAHNIRVKRSLDPGLDQSAIEAIQQWKFDPGRRKGEPATVLATIEVNFRLY